jgi:hypothetical protein
MLCSCPTEPGSVWSVESVTARILRDDRTIAESELEYAGEESHYAGTLEAPGPGTYRLQVTAADPANGNFGEHSRPFVVR